MDDETSRLSSLSRATEDFLPRENEKLQTRVDELSSELHALRQTLPFLEQVDSTSVDTTFKTLVSRCATLTDERDSLLASQRQRDEETRVAVERLDAENATLRRRVASLEEQRNELLARCVTLEKRLDDDISLFYRNGESRPINTTGDVESNDIRRLVDVISSGDGVTIVTRDLKTIGLSLEDARSRLSAELSVLTAAHDKISLLVGRPPRPPTSAASPSPPSPLISTRDVRAYADSRPAIERSYFSRLDESASECSSHVSRDGRIQSGTFKPSGVVAVNETIESSATAIADTAGDVAQYAAMVARYRDNLRLVVDQLRHTANFLASRVSSSGGGRNEIDELITRIRALQAEIEGSCRHSNRLLDESNRINDSLTRLNQTMISSSDVERVMSAHYVESGTVPRAQEQIASSAARDAQLNELWSRNHTLLADANARERRICELERVRNDLAERHEEAVKSVEARDRELENRERIIETLKERVLALDADLEARENDAAAPAATSRHRQTRNNSTTSPEESTENANNLHAEIERLRHELQHQAVLFDDICAAMPTVSFKQHEGVEAQTARIVQHISKLRAYVERVEPLTDSIAEFNKRIERRIIEGARASGVELPIEFLVDARELTLSPLTNGSRSSIAQIAAYFAKLVTHGESIVRLVSVVADSNRSVAVGELLIALRAACERLTNALLRAQTLFERSKQSHRALRGMEQEIADELGCIYDSLQPRHDD